MRKRKRLAKEKVKHWKKALREYDQVSEQDIVTPVEQQAREALEALDAAQPDLQSLYENLAAAENPEDYGEAVMHRLRSYRRASVDLGKANSTLLENYDELSARWDDLTRQHHSRLKAPANSVIDLEETRSDHFAAGMNLYKLLLVCFIGCFGGVVIELAWCLLTNGYLQSRSGLVYGPFNMVYGAGALVLTVALYRYRNRGKWLSFLGGFLVGSALEYFCSWAQEIRLRQLGLQPYALQYQRADLPGLFRFLGLSGCLLGENPLSHGGTADSENSQPLRQDPNLGTDGLLRL